MGEPPHPPLVLAPQAPKKCHFFGIFGGSRGVPPGPSEDLRKPRFWALRTPLLGPPGGPKLGSWGPISGGPQGLPEGTFLSRAEEGGPQDPRRERGEGGGLPHYGLSRQQRAIVERAAFGDPIGRAARRQDEAGCRRQGRSGDAKRRPRPKWPQARTNGSQVASV